MLPCGLSKYNFHVSKFCTLLKNRLQIKCVSTATGRQRALDCSPIITSSGRGNTEDEGVEIELAEARVTAPLDTLELRRLLLGSGHRRRLRFLFEDAHI